MKWPTGFLPQLVILCPTDFYRKDKFSPPRGRWRSSNSAERNPRRTDSTANGWTHWWSIQFNGKPFINTTAHLKTIYKKSHLFSAALFPPNSICKMQWDNENSRLFHLKMLESLKVIIKTPQIFTDTVFGGNAPRAEGGALTVGCVVWGRAEVTQRRNK